jgi:hypothetical protein
MSMIDQSLDDFFQHFRSDSIFDGIQTIDPAIPMYHRLIVVVAGTPRIHHSKIIDHAQKTQNSCCWC